MKHGSLAGGGMMTTEMIVSLYDYGAWANERLLTEAARLTDAELRRRWSQGCQSIHETFVHLVSADTRWFSRWRLEPPPAVLTASDFPTLDAIRARWARLIEPRRAYLAALRDAELAEVITVALQDRPLTLPRWQALIHCANHGTQHRSEIAAMLTDAGHSPGDLDYTVWTRS